jgi:heat shock protein HslJ
MIQNRVLAAGIIFCLLFISIIFILISDQNHPLFPAPEANTSPDEGGTVLEPQKPGISQVTGNGIVIYEDIEGGFFGVISDEGRRFLPRALPEYLKVNGTAVSYEFRTEPDVVSSFMWGEPVEILSIRALFPATTKNSTRSALVEYERAGGVTGAYESLVMYPDGNGEVRRWNLVEQITVEQEDIENLTRAIHVSEFSALRSEYMPVSPVPDAVTYTITINNKSVKTSGSYIPSQIKPLLTLLTEILENNSISPVTANISLEGTSWKLSSLTRPDGIPVTPPENSRVTAVFENGNVINGSTGCSPYSAVFTQSGTSLVFGPPWISRVACTEPGAGDVESAFLDLLEKVRKVTGKHKTLTLTDGNNSPLLIFEQADPGQVIS